LRDQIETQVPGTYGPGRKAVILDRLMWATNFENFLSQKWTAAKRFGLEGCETLIPGMLRFIDFRCVLLLPILGCLLVVLYVHLFSFRVEVK
jgi:2-oxoglutarate dehydrogenase complex dehydrogenase (E1) component-like enzyme